MDKNFCSILTLLKICNLFFLILWFVKVSKGNENEKKKKKKIENKFN